jgi:hypothetical protein
MKEKVLFQTNVPVTAALAYPDGMKVEGRYGDQVMYSLIDGRVMYVPPIVRDKLVELGIHQNDPFSICKAEQRDGNRRYIEWAVKRIPPEQPDTGDPVHAASRPPAVVPAAPSVAVPGNGNGKPNGKTAGASNGSHAGQASLRSALSASIDAAIEAERYATEHGLSVRFGSEDLRAMALSLFIQYARDGGVR